MLISNFIPKSIIRLFQSKGFQARCPLAGRAELLGTAFGQMKMGTIDLCNFGVTWCYLFEDFFLTYNLLTIASFRIGVPSILFFQCLALPKDPQSFGSQNLRCPFLVSQYYRRRRLWNVI